MSDRLAELVRQRALVQEHLAWLNREIAAAAESSKSAAGSAPAPLLPAAVNTAPPATASIEAKSADPDEIIARYQATPANVKQDVRKGCLLYFAAAFLLLGLVVTVLYFTLSQGH
ncbi:MAG: hypothetical protein JNL92_08935 [Opitutaceae bacterium]|nr:hypothetical protein [Opitutaceae bacterium]